jgi:hypothetical protein
MTIVINNEISQADFSEAAEYLRKYQRALAGIAPAREDAIYFQEKYYDSNDESESERFLRRWNFAEERATICEDRMYEYAEKIEQLTGMSVGAFESLVESKS